jgi:beta-lactamase regulating signal transducer with metallopeptidase domain
MTPELIFELGLKSVAAAGATLLLLRLLARRSAGEKALVAHLGLLALVLLPLAVLAMPALELPAPATVAPFLAGGEVAPIESASGPAVAMAAVPSPDWRPFALAAYLLPALALLVALAVAVVRLQRVRARAEVLVEPSWLAALARAQRRLGFKHGTALLTSGELVSPVSWGVVRPIIIVDRAAAADSERAEAIIAHELAHVERLDWLKLLAGRVATALFWFNPLVWMLARQAHQLSEEAADDAVLRAEIGRADYAELLLTAARHANRPALLAANGVAPSRSSLARRVAHVLDASRPRGAARAGWACASLVAALGISAALAAAEPAAPAPLARFTATDAGEADARSAGSLALVEALIEAARRGNLAAMAELIEAGASPDSVLDGDGTPLIAAAQDGRAESVSFLLERGADVNLAVRGDGNPLIAAAGTGRTDIVRTLLDRGADIEAAVPGDENALITASRNGRTEVVRLLVERGADVNRAVDGRSPLAMAQAGGHAAIASLLREAGAMR